MLQTVEPPEELLTPTELAKRDDLKTRKPRVYEKVRRFNERADEGVISPILRLAYNFLCNMHCEHCCAEHYMDRHLIQLTGKREQRRELTHEDIGELARQADEYGIFRFVLTGGEPLTYKDLYTVIKVIDPDRHLVICDSNAWLLDDERARQLADNGVYKMQVSLDSFDEQEHDRFRNKPGSYKRVMRSIPAVLKTGMKLILSTCLVHDRVLTQEFEDLCKFCTDNGCGLYVTYAKPVGNCKQHMEWVLTKQDADRLRLLEKKYNVFTHMTPSFGRHTGCITVKGINTVTSTGEIVPCPYMDWSIGNFLHEPLATILNRGMLIKDLGPQRNDCVIGEDMAFIRRHNAKVEGRVHLPVPFGEGWTEDDLIQRQTV